MAKGLDVSPRWPHVALDWSRFSAAWSAANRLASVLGADLATIFFVPLPWFGLVLWAAIAQHDPRYAAFGLLGLGIGYLVARGLGISDIPMLGGGIKANALLMALAAGWLTIPLPIPTQAKVLVATISALAAAIITAAVIRTLVRFERRRYRPYRAGNGCSEEGGYGMPSLTSGYCIVAGALFVLFPAWTATAVQATPAWIMPADMPGWLSAFLRSLGSMLFSPTVSVGIVVAGALILWSRTLFVAGTVGWVCGAYTALIIQGIGTEFYWLPASYNFFLAGMALGAVFLLPGRMTLPLAAIGGCSAAVIAAVLQHIAPSWAYLPISAVLAIWIGLGAITISEERTHFWRNYARRFPPAEAWWREANWAKRFGRRDPLLVVPVPGLLQIAQGFEGPLSHVGSWSHALDLQRPPSATGDAVSSIWNAPVSAPAAGIAERVRDNVPDNPLGICNYADNWGNYVVIRLDQGGWALLAHLREKSITVSAGARVEIGTYIGAVGNSGRSPIPHLHMQVQRAPDPGAATIPFRLANYESVDASTEAGTRWHAIAVPSERAIIAAATPNPTLRTILASLAPGVAIWTIESHGRVPHSFRQRRRTRTAQIEIRMDPAGQHVFRADAHTMIGSVDPDAWRILEVSHGAPPLLRLLALGAPSIPYAARASMVWHELVPVNAIEPGWLGIDGLPYAKQPFTELRCMCRVAPGSKSDPIVVETTGREAHPGLPLRVTTQFELLRGPVKVEAVFPEGRVRYSLLSFEPSAPFQDA